jgi:hypothetical protein
LGIGIQDSVGIDDKPANFRVLEVSFDSRIVGALGKPYSSRISTEAVSIILASDLDLGSNGLGKFPHEREEPVGGAAGNNFQNSRILKFSKGLDEVTMVAITKEMAAVIESVVIKTGEGLEGGIVLGAVEFLGREFDLFFESVDVSVL